MRALRPLDRVPQHYIDSLGLALHGEPWIANACGVGAGAPSMAFDIQRRSQGATPMQNDPFGYTVSTVYEALRQQFSFVLACCGGFWTGSANLWTALSCSGRLCLGLVLDGFGRFWEAMEGSGWAVAGLMEL